MAKFKIVTRVYEPGGDPVYEVYRLKGRWPFRMWTPLAPVYTSRDAAEAHVKRLAEYPQTRSVAEYDAKGDRILYGCF